MSAKMSQLRRIGGGLPSEFDAVLEDIHEIEALNAGFDWHNSKNWNQQFLEEKEKCHIKIIKL